MDNRIGKYKNATSKNKFSSSQLEAKFQKMLQSKWVEYLKTKNSTCLSNIIDFLPFYSEHPAWAEISKILKNQHSENSEQIFEIDFDEVFGLWNMLKHHSKYKHSDIETKLSYIAEQYGIKNNPFTDSLEEKHAADKFIETIRQPILDRDSG
tara:strand:- start:308 stop:763 length:456 start_codon:yes stop_codon:yes gene_type:complete